MVFTADDVRDEVRDLCREAVHPLRPGESVKAALRRAAIVLGMPQSRIKRLWYSEVQQVPAHEYLTIKQRVDERRRSRAAELRDEIRHLEERHGRERAEFVEAHPALARFAPPPVLPLAPRSSRKG